MKDVGTKAIAAVALGILLAGCTTPSGRPDYAANGALIGGTSGAAIGALAARHAPGAGALVGGVAGLIAGGLIGHSMDEQARYELPPPPPYYAPPPPPPAAYSRSPAVQTLPPTPPPTVSDIEGMAKSGTNDDAIIAQINSTHAVYRLDADALIELKNAGVSEKVIACMENTGAPAATPASP